MFRSNFIILVMTTLACVAPEGQGRGSPSQVVIHVGGMIKTEDGHTWMAWPEAVKKALEGLSEVTLVELDLEDDLMRISGKTTYDLAARVVQGCGYTPTERSPGDFRLNPSTIHPTGSIPTAIQELMARARSEGKKFILVDCTSPT